MFRIHGYREVNLEKVRAIQEMKPPANINEVQRLAGCIAALSRFISRSAEWSLSFFKALRKTKDFIWDEEFEQAFQDLKIYLAQLPLLTKPIPGETLYLYLAASQQTVSSVIIKEGHQEPIYYVSKPRSAIKAQALEEFVNEATFTEENERNWLFHVDDSSTLVGSGAGVVLTSSEGDELEYALRFHFKASNNEAENEVFIPGIRMALDARARNLIVYSDS
ncbi:UNVERIFIED_CONTAM: hypothetical protein Slati_2906500 [Sesamum latifolium]|uniref:Reverse transcriptase/retrotransposon-derived protein RNase H-like domain-containing protein n=1 Tax=Sesamum latifolium TaxID=2727402 RepID=A0AAW2VD43_9LAMI